LDKFVKRRHTGKIRWLEHIERWTAKRAKQVITPSVYLKGIVEKWGVASEKIHAIYNSIQGLPAGRSREEVRTASAVTGKKVLFTAVRAVPWKNIDFLIRLLPKLNDENTILIVAGDGPCLDAWKAEAQKTGVSDRVRFLGKLDRKSMGEWYRAADLFVLPSLYEGYPNVIPEAESQGLPSLVSDHGGNKELMSGMTRICVLDRWLDELNKGLPERSPILDIDTGADFNCMFDQTVHVLERAAE
jgi:UDP-glucose:(heptosyl)LPS alpha-1,3-glucosyltransferase